MNVYIVLHVHDMYMSCHECVSMLHVMYMHTASKLIIIYLDWKKIECQNISAFRFD